MAVGRSARGRPRKPSNKAKLFRRRSAASTSPAAIAAILAIARYAEANRERLLELDVNPLMLRAEGQGALAVDALIVEAADR